MGLFVTAAFRYRMTLKYENKVTEFILKRRTQCSDQPALPNDETVNNNYIYLPRFRTAGAIVLCVSVFILSIEIVIMVLLCNL